MIIQIEIECETVGEMIEHLSVIRLETKRLAMRLQLNNGDELAPTEWEDDNCYGRHVVSIREDEMLKDHHPGTGMFGPSK